MNLIRFILHWIRIAKRRATGDWWVVGIEDWGQCFYPLNKRTHKFIMKDGYDDWELEECEAKCRELNYRAEGKIL